MIEKCQKFAFIKYRRGGKRKGGMEEGINDKYGKMLVVVETARPVVLKMWPPQPAAAAFENLLEIPLLRLTPVSRDQKL